MGEEAEDKQAGGREINALCGDNEAWADAHRSPTPVPRVFLIRNIWISMAIHT